MRVRYLQTVVLWSPAVRRASRTASRSSRNIDDCEVQVAILLLPRPVMEPILRCCLCPSRGRRCKRRAEALTKAVGPTQRVDPRPRQLPLTSAAPPATKGPICRKQRGIVTLVVAAAAVPSSHAHHSNFIDTAAAPGTSPTHLSALLCVTRLLISIFANFGVHPTGRCLYCCTAD